MTFVKDRGFSWIVLAASFLNQMIAIGILLCSGIYIVTFIEHFKCTKRAAAAVGAIAYGTQCLMGPASGALYRKFGCRIVIQVGGTLASLGLFLSFWVEDLIHLYLTFLLVGIGFGLVYSPSVGILPDYFDKYRYFAVSFATVGGAVGTLLFSPIFVTLINCYTWRGSMLIISGVALQTVVLGGLMQSRTLEKDLKWKQVFEIYLFRDVKFLSMFLDGACFGGSVYVVFGMANQLAISRGSNKIDSAILVSIMGVCNVVGRVSSSIIAQCACTNRLLYFTVSGCLCGIFSCLASLSDDIWSLRLTLGLFGMFFGTKLAQLAAANMELFGANKLITTIGYSMFSFGVGGLSLPLLAALVADRSKVDNAYILAGGSLLFSFCLLCIFVVRLRKPKNRLPTTLPSESSNIQLGNNLDVDGSVSETDMKL